MLDAHPPAVRVPAAARDFVPRFFAWRVASWLAVLIVVFVRRRVARVSLHVSLRSDKAPALTRKHPSASSASSRAGCLSAGAQGSDTAGCGCTAPSASIDGLRVQPPPPLFV